MHRGQARVVHRIAHTLVDRENQEVAFLGSERVGIRQRLGELAAPVELDRKLRAVGFDSEASRELESRGRIHELCLDRSGRVPRVLDQECGACGLL